MFSFIKVKFLLLDNTEHYNKQDQVRRPLRSEDRNSKNNDAGSAAKAAVTSSLYAP